MKNRNLLVLALAGVAVWMILQANKASAAPATRNPARRTNPYLDQYPTGPNGEGLF